MGQPTELRPGVGAQKELDACLLAVAAKVAFAVTGLLFGIGQGHGRSRLR
jgi:hypothetical protein